MLLGNVDVRLLDQTVLHVGDVLCVQNSLVVILGAATIPLIEMPDEVRLALLRLEMNIQKLPTILHAAAQLYVIQRHVTELTAQLALLVKVLVAADAMLKMQQTVRHQVSVAVRIDGLPFLEIALPSECHFLLLSVLTC